MTLAFAGITWLTPLSGIVLASILVPLLVALYFLKLRRKAAAVPSTLLWKRSVEDLRANAPFQRLRLNMMLLLQFLLLAFVAFAIAQPRMDIGAGSGGRTVLLIDRSASMGATDLGAGVTRLSEAKRQAAERVEQQFSGGLFTASPGEVMVVAFSDGAEVVQPFTHSKADALRAIERIQPTDGGSSITEALALARAHTAVASPDAPDAAAAAPVVFELYSDGRIQGLDEEALRSNEGLEFHVIGRADAANLGIEGIAAERSMEDPGLMQVFVMLRNDGPEAVETDLQLGVDGTVRWVSPAPVSVPGGAVDPQTGQWQAGVQRFTLPPIVQPRAGSISVEVVRADALMVDNLAEIAVAAPRRLRLAAVGDLNFALMNVVQAIPVEKLERLTPDEFSARVAQAGASEFDVVVANAPALPSPLPPGRYLIFGVPAGLEGLNPYADKEHIEVSSHRSDHPVLRAVNLDDLLVARAVAIAPSSDIEKLIEAVDTPLVVVARRGPVQAIVASFDSLDSNWPFQRGFVTFVANAVEWLGSMDQAAVQEEHRPGATLVARLPPGSTGATMQLPGGETRAVVVRDGVVTFGPVERAGVYTLAWQEPAGSGRRAFAVNPAGGEGHIAAAGAIALGARAIAGQSSSGNLLSDLWPFALAASILLLMIEWWAYHRRHWLRRTPTPARAASIIRA